MPGAGREQQGQAAPQGCTPCSSVPGTVPAHHGRGQGDVERHGQHCRQHCQEHFLPPRRKVCAGSGNTESFPERGVMSWQQRESPVSWEGLGVLPSLTVAPCHTLALNTTDGSAPAHQRGLCRTHCAFNPPCPEPSTPRSRQGVSQMNRAGRRLPDCLPPLPPPRCSRHDFGQAAKTCGAQDLDPS